MKYHNSYQSPDGTFFVLICTRVGRYTDTGYASIEEAAWQADRAKWFLNNHGLIGRLTAYNFASRLDAEGDSAWSVLPQALLDFVNAHRDSTAPMTENDAAKLEEANLLAQSAIDRQGLIDEATKKLTAEVDRVLRGNLELLCNRVRDSLREFDAIHLPKSTKERNALTHALGLLCSRLAQLS